jgi:hypothetical protein
VTGTRASVATSWFAFEPARLAPLAAAERERYEVARPFPHAVIDGLFPDEVLDAVVAEFPPPDPRWRHFDDANQRKFGAGHVEVDMGPATRNVMAELNSATFVGFVQELTGIAEPLLPDPHLRGGGLHQVLPDGYLEVHADFNRHPLYGLDRRVNVLVYLNRDWNTSWGGQLELWDRAMARPEQRVDPVFNRTVVFSLSDTAYHGHPHPLRCPAGQARRSLALYYYSNGRPPAEQSDPHSTLFQRRPGPRGAARQS